MSSNALQYTARANQLQWDRKAMLAVSYIQATRYIKWPWPQWRPEGGEGGSAAPRRHFAGAAFERRKFGILAFALECVRTRILHCALAAAQCIVIGPVCGFVCLWVCYHDNSKLRASILTKLGF